MVQEKKRPVILASLSPRRQELLKQLISEFEVVASGVEEEKIEEKDPLLFAIKAAEEKARRVGTKNKEALVLGFDTVVTIDHEILGKPKIKEEAIYFLQKLSGREHRVITGIALYQAYENKTLTGYEISRVKFKNLTEKEINAYLAKESHWDKAGAYGIQEVGEEFVEWVKGDYYNVVGLPLNRLKKLLKQFDAPEVELKIEDYALPRDFGVGRSSRLVVFVPKVVLDDLVRVRIVKESKNFAYGEVVKIEQPSPYRVEAPCPHFELCGGCVFQNLSYEKQLEIKEKYLANTLEKIGGINLEKVRIIKINPSPQAFHYRNKMEFAFGEEAGSLILGLRERSYPYFPIYHKRVIKLNSCEIFSPTVKEIFPEVLRWLNGFLPYDPITKKGFLRHLVIKEGKRTKELMIILVTKTGELGCVEELAQSLKEKIPEMKSFYWVTNDQISDVVKFQEKKYVLGQEYIEEELGSLKFRVYPNAFFQPNPLAAEVLYRKLLEYVESSDRVLGLYCGVGCMEMMVAKKAREVVGVDSEEINIIGAKESAKLNSINNISFHCSFAEGIISQKFRNFDLLLLDPPRGGLSKKALIKVLKLSLPRVIYVSCNPATLARDLKELIRGGYQLKEVIPFDFFPHAAHLETLCYLEASR